MRHSESTGDRILKISPYLRKLLSNIKGIFYWRTLYNVQCKSKILPPPEVLEFFPKRLIIFNKNFNTYIETGAQCRMCRENPPANFGYAFWLFDYSFPSYWVLREVNGRPFVSGRGEASFWNFFPNGWKFLIKILILKLHKTAKFYSITPNYDKVMS